LGVGKEWAFSDVLGLDEELLAFVPAPCIAVMFLFPYSKMKLFRKELTPTPVHPDLYFMQQLVGNACGTVAVVHCLANNLHKLSLSNGFFKQFLEKTKSTTPLERGRLFGREKALHDVHTSMAKDSEVQTEVPAADAKVDFHFICFVEYHGQLYELDGAKDFPINHGPTNPDLFLYDAVKKIKENFIEKLKDELLFSVISLGPPGEF